MFEIYTDGFRLLWEHHEFQVLIRLFRYGLLALAGLVVVVGLLHVLYMLGFNSPLYRRRSPRVGWSKKILPALALLFAAFTGLFWLSGQWIAQAS